MLAPATSPTQHGRNSSHDTIDGRNPAPVEVARLSHDLQGFIHPRWFAGFLNQQQYGPFVWDLQDVLAFFAQHDVVDRISDVQKAG